MNRGSIYFRLTAVLAATAFLYACGTNSAAETKTATQTEAAAQAKASIIGNKTIKSVIEELVTFDNEDYYSDWENENPNYIEL